MFIYTCFPHNDSGLLCFTSLHIFSFAVVNLCVYCDLLMDARNNHCSQSLGWGGGGELGLRKQPKLDVHTQYTLCTFLLLDRTANTWPVAREQPVWADLDF